MREGMPYRFNLIRSLHISLVIIVHPVRRTVSFPKVSVCLRYVELHYNNQVISPKKG